MAFYLKTGENVEQGVKRIVAEQITKAIEEIDNEDLDNHTIVHQVRKRCKKIRGVFRLVRPLFPEYSQENAWFRDAAKELSYVRDAEAVVETFDIVVETFNSQISAERFESLRETLTERRKEIAKDKAGIEKKLVEFRQKMCEARDRLNDWKLEAEEFEAIEPGLVKTYRRGQKAMGVALEDPTVENFHEWRKRAKYHWYHTRLLREIWKPVMKKICNEVKDLSDYLGDDHNLAVFRRMILDSPGEFGGNRDLQFLLGLIDRYSAELRTSSETLGRRVFGEKPKQLGARFRSYWEAWREEKQRNSSMLSQKPAVVTAQAEQ